MRRVWLIGLLFLTLICGCTLSNNGSQAIHFNPFGFASGGAVFTPATGGNFVDGERWNHR